MNLARRFFFLIIFGCLISCSSGSDCSYNTLYNAGWEATFRQSVPNMIITNSEVGYDSYYNDTGITRYLINENDSFCLRKYVFADACAAKKWFDSELEYYQSDKPRYEMNDGTRFGLLQDKNYLTLDAGMATGLDSMAQHLFTSLCKSILCSKPEKNSVFVKFCYKKAVLE
jgi:hypothetical protein